MSDPAITKINGYSPEELTGESLELFYANPNEYGHQGSGRVGLTQMHLNQASLMNFIISAKIETFSYMNP